jgi:hypothetical protein
LNNFNQLRGPAILNLDYSHLGRRRNPAPQRFQQEHAETQDHKQTKFLASLNHALVIF